MGLISDEDVVYFKDLEEKTDSDFSGLRLIAQNVTTNKSWQFSLDKIKNISSWTARTYYTDPSMAIFDGNIYVCVGTIPYVSTNIVTEYEAGDWTKMSLEYSRSFTPEVYKGGGTYTYTASAIYNISGKIATITGKITINTFTSAGTTMAINNLPGDIYTTYGFRSLGKVQLTGRTTSTISPVIELDGEDNVLVFAQADSNGNRQELTPDAANNVFYFTITYPII